MLRILQVVNIMDRAGLETMLMNYYRHIDRNQIQFDFLTHRPDKGAYDSEIESLGGKVYRAPRLYPQNYISYFKFMKSFFEAHQEYRIIHSHIDTMSAFPLYAALKSKVPIRISHSHSTKLDRDVKMAIKYFAKLVVPKVANVYAACGQSAGEFLYGKKQDFTVIPNAIDLDKFSYDSVKRLIKRKELGIESELVIGNVGRFSYVKNQMFLIEVFEELIKEEPNALLLLVGKGEDEKKLKKRVDELNLEDKVRFLLDRSDVHELYQAMDVFVMPSLFEGLPVVGIEAQASGLPCIISDRISKELLLTESTYMKSLKKNSKKDWAKSILNGATKRFVDNCSRLRVSGYDINLEAKKLMEWYERLSRIGNGGVLANENRHDWP